MGKLTDLLIQRAKTAKANLSATTPGRGGPRTRHRSAHDESRTSDVHDAPTGRRGQMNVSFRRTERDAQPPREVVSGLLLGDPWPGRPMPGDDPTAYNEAVAAGEIEPPRQGICLFMREELLLVKES